jgi:hypothetical protein
MNRLLLAVIAASTLGLSAAAQAATTKVEGVPPFGNCS